MRGCVNHIERAISNRPLMYVVFHFGNILKAKPLVQNCNNCVDCHIVDEGLVPRARLQHMCALRWKFIQYWRSWLGWRWQRVWIWLRIWLWLRCRFCASNAISHLINYYYQNGLKRTKSVDQKLDRQLWQLSTNSTLSNLLHARLQGVLVSISQGSFQVIYGVRAKWVTVLLLADLTSLVFQDLLWYNLGQFSNQGFKKAGVRDA